MRSREAAAGEDSFASAGAFVAPTLIQSACVEWCSGLAAHLRRGPFFRKKKSGSVQCHREWRARASKYGAPVVDQTARVNWGTTTSRRTLCLK